SLTLPPEMTQLSAFFVGGNPLATFVLSETLAATGLTSAVNLLRNQGVSVFTYPVAAQLVRLVPLVGAFQFGIAGPPGNYSIFVSTNLAQWNVLGTVSNPLGGINFVDVTSNAAPRKFYSALLQSPPADMVFISPNTFVMGSPTNDFTR